MLSTIWDVTTQCCARSRSNARPATSGAGGPVAKPSGGWPMSSGTRRCVRGRLLPHNYSRGIS